MGRGSCEMQEIIRSSAGGGGGGVVGVAGVVSKSEKRLSKIKAARIRGGVLRRLRRIYRKSDSALAGAGLYHREGNFREEKRAH